MTDSFPLVRAAEAEDLAALDHAVFAGGCFDNAKTSAAALSKDILKLYYAQWDSFLPDVKLARLTALSAHRENLKDLLSADSALTWLVTAIVCKTELMRCNDEPAPACDNKAVDGSPVMMVSDTGSWAWLRMLRTARFTATSLADVYSLRVGAVGYYGDLTLKASSIDYPYNLQMFKKFSCPAQI
ncbi:hypothetical protein FJ937_13350 [Mesorhizobium sp. B2-4-4]|uniref:ImcF-related family protein n=1 Tax=unclassified Mesorhizobium TaxID=325217 RepID=UPI00112B3582|nr:hypothetical protein FJW11_18630 [Mesorhizobium sp. B3-1-1]TPJ64031.1 hypothetical protein FJ462_22130 [Mesorhizobium sp. B2-6-7]TPJ83469.1 hypothetical protein FJ422_18180 [Mesorhizobium sp. B2-6-3]TPJ97529.1 hypothetical protein FJ491_19095 [Mesorhizobium sp. B2-5-10]TPK07278.1 hypothetical protein FJ490_22495 [Mesorhizobium sp. B2-5-11]TPK30243.1 hypothetical protein FJ885_23035 [Mesorhizobium sp. B2-5-8]TPK32311.1 hypothetical protein FJ867_21380 [Mesorhizobium sp. B2-5-3]TPL14427.1 h